MHQIYFTFKHLLYHQYILNQAISLLNKIKSNILFTLSLKFYDNEIFEAIRLETGIDENDISLQDIYLIN